MNRTQRTLMIPSLTARFSSLSTASANPTAATDGNDAKTSADDIAREDYWTLAEKEVNEQTLI